MSSDQNSQVHDECCPRESKHELMGAGGTVDKHFSNTEPAGKCLPQRGAHADDQTDEMNSDWVQDC